VGTTLEIESGLNDAMAVTTVLERENVIRVHALSGFTDFPPFFEAPLPEPQLLTEAWDHRIIDDMYDPIDERRCSALTESIIRCLSSSVTRCQSNGSLGDDVHVPSG